MAGLVLRRDTGCAIVYRTVEAVRPSSRQAVRQEGMNVSDQRLPRGFVAYRRRSAPAREIVQGFADIMTGPPVIETYEVVEEA